MRSYDAHHLRNIALLGHSGSGKTTLAEAMLFESGEIPRRGAVDDGSTTSDYREVEVERHGSVYGTPLFAEWRDYKINILDTPGYVDYVGEVVGALRVADTGVIVLSSPQGVEVGTQIVASYAASFRTPLIFVVNKVDHDQSNFWRTVEQSKDRFGREVTVVQYPLVEGSGFTTIIDVLTMTAYVFPEHGGKPEKQPIPASEMERARRLHNELVEIIAENDGTLMDHYLEHGKLDEAEMSTGLTEALVHRQLFPIFCTSAKRDMGIGRLMSFIDLAMPAPVEMPPVQTLGGSALSADPSGTTCLFVYKAMSEPNVGDMSLFRVYSGTVRPGMDLVNEQTGITERLGQLYVINGKHRFEVAELQAGDLGAVVKLKNTHVNNTLHEKGQNLVVPPIVFPKPKVRTAVVSNRQGDEDKVGVALHHILEEDPTLQVEHSTELHQVLLHGQGEMHLQTTKHRLEHRYNLDLRFEPAKVPYRETILSTVDASYRHKKQTGGAGQFAEVHLRVEPWHHGMPDPAGITVRHTDHHELPWGGTLVMINGIVGGVIDQRFLPAITKGIMERMQVGPITGSYVRDVRVSVFDGKMHPVDSSEAAFKAAGKMAFRDAFIRAQPQLLEPIYSVRIVVPEELVGSVISDLPSRRGEVHGMESEGHYGVVHARLPLMELDRYSSALRSLTAGQATFTADLHDYLPVPAQVQHALHTEYLSRTHDDEA